MLANFEDPIMLMRARGDSLAVIQTKLKRRNVQVSRMTILRFIASMPDGRLEHARRMLDDDRGGVAG